IQAIAGRLNRLNDPGSIRLAIVEELRQLVNYEACRVYVREGDLLIPAALRAEHDEYRDEKTDEFVVQVGQGITGWVALHGEPALLDDAENDPRGQHVAGSDYIDESMMIVPMKYDERVVGVISVSKLGLRQFTPLDLHMLGTLADQAAVAIENAHLIRRLEADAEALRRSEERYQFVARATTDVIWESDFVTGDLTWTGAIESMFGYCNDDVRGGEWWEERIHPADRDRVVQGINASIASAREMWSDEYRFRRHVGTYATLIDRGYLVMDSSGRPTRMIGSMMDISERKALEEQLAHQAFHDPLTGLPNRPGFLDRVQHALLRTTREGGSIAVLFLDLDRFKVINDSLGHEAGDHLLKAVADRLSECLRPDDTVARLGGDEFTILLESDATAGEALRIANRLTQTLQKPFNIDGHDVFVTTSIGIAIKHPHHEAPADLMRDADLAMYRAKERGRACCEVFDPSMNVRAQQRLSMENDLRHAIERGELLLDYQPTVNLRTGMVCGAEALVRWQHPVRGLVNPGDFIRLAEETGLIFPIGRWIIEEACRQLRAWNEKRPLARPLSVSVNLSARQFASPTLTSEIASALAFAEANPASLVLEITETVVMEDAEVNITTLRRLKELGVQLAIDDFGTGYSSLAYLKRFPVDTLKIDKDFVSSLGKDTEDSAIVNAVITLAHTLGMQVTAEGVETDNQIRQLRELGCDLAQGYLFARPMNAAALTMLPQTLPVVQTLAR
ncbi:MAG: EAL domain-containing protein, partial [Chloroflexota bacterium]|nr:EAL domain-containing protein [Chloroflexota bacterium]